jgi:uncharacterized protein YecT (DUF1311 family)
MRTLHLFIFIITLCSLPVLAAPIKEAWHLPASSDEQLGIRPAFFACLASELGQSVAGRKECLGTENQFQDSRLNRAYKAALTRLSPAQAKLLKNSQLGWLKMLPAHCQLEAGYPEGGTDAVEADALCHMHWRAYRAKYIESL